MTWNRWGARWAAGLIGVLFGAFAAEAARPGVPPASPSPARVVRAEWRAEPDERFILEIECDRAPRHINVTDEGFRPQGLYVDLYGVTEPAEPAGWTLGGPLVSTIRRMVYPAQGVLRYVLYTPGPVVFVTHTVGPRLKVEVMPRRTAPGRRLVVLDPGHGGRADEPTASLGARTSVRIDGRYYYEKDIVLDIARRLERRTLRDPDLDCYLTRTSDRYVSLEDRVAIADRVEGDLFISIHLNATDTRRKTARGFEVYYLSDTDRAVDRTLLALENDLQLHADRRVAEESIASLLRSLADDQLAERRSQSRALAEQISEVFARAGPFREYHRGIKYAPFRVLMNFRMPAVLVECGFLDHPVEGRALVDPQVQEQIAALLHESIRRYFASVDPAFPVASPAAPEPAVAGAGAGRDP